ncbi:MAG: hypothetical protein F4Y67_09090 [Chloroflexi bacterium]|nr:aryl-sulfate sulfotransferase [Chloroflexota bacterium]MXW27608.1 hypothetical protein [Chloroflexota bacterium]MXY00953.1 hypothetical protein [Chloroflexota bacterium]MYB15999.1 hypothetical protein [Chloroflexota bacterium]MYC46851.1 hypothetical protein [Chloroflexota bacterium]
MGWSIAQPTGLTYNRSTQTYKGYTLICPSGSASVYLIDMQGRIVHTWEPSFFRCNHCKLLPNGNLLALGRDSSIGRPDPPMPGDPQLPFDEDVRRLGANATELREIDWQGQTVWSHRNWYLHHDFHRTADGRTFVLEFAQMSKELTDRVQGGFVPAGDVAPEQLIGDDLVELDADGEEIGRWALHEYLDPEVDILCPLDMRHEWSHANGIDVDGDRLLLSLRNTHTVLILDRVKDAITWRYGWPKIAHQHNATFVDGGKVQIFDNGTHAPRSQVSSILEVDPATDEETWRYQANPREQFYSGHISGAQRLPNRSVLICEGTSGRVFEVMRTGQEVWEWINPFINQRPDGVSMSWLFRAYRYGLDYPAFVGKDLDPRRFAALNRAYGLGIRGARWR